MTDRERNEVKRLRMNKKFMDELRRWIFFEGKWFISRNKTSRKYITYCSILFVLFLVTIPAGNISLIDPFLVISKVCLHISINTSHINRKHRLNILFVFLIGTLKFLNWFLRHYVSSITNLTACFQKLTIRIEFDKQNEQMSWCRLLKY
jgi:hypothetical protein